jgi:predicted dehydrogenase
VSDGVVRLAVVGVGHLGRLHARVAASLPGIRVIGVHDHHEGRAAEVARELSLGILPSLEDVAREADAVVLATPTVSHAELAAYFLDRGKDVLIEKPMTATLPEAEALLERARRGGRVMAVGHIERHNPAFEAALSIVEHPRFVEAHRLAVFTPRSLDVDVVLDLMIHDLQLVLALVASPVREIRAAGIPVLTSRLDIANARIAFEGGCVANLTASRVSSGRTRKCRIFASALYVSVDLQARTLAAFRLSRAKAQPEIVPVPVEVPSGDPLARELSDFARAVRERGRPLVSGEEGRDALVLAHQVLEAIEEHRRSVEGASA